MFVEWSALHVAKKQKAGYLGSFVALNDVFSPDSSILGYAINSAVIAEVRAHVISSIEREVCDGGIVIGIHAKLENSSKNVGRVSLISYRFDASLEARAQGRSIQSASILSFPTQEPLLSKSKSRTVRTEHPPAKELVRACKVCAFDKARSVCSRCRGVYYCSADCQKADWKAHRLTCQPPTPLFVVPQPNTAAYIMEGGQLEKVAVNNFTHVVGNAAIVASAPLWWQCIMYQYINIPMYQCIIIITTITKSDSTSFVVRFFLSPFLPFYWRDSSDNYSSIGPNFRIPFVPLHLTPSFLPFLLPPPI